MKTHKSFQIPTISIHRQNQPTLAEIESLLDLFPQAALLLDLPHNRVLLANSKATELTAFTRAELTAQAVSDLLPALSGHQLQSETSGNLQSFTASLAMRNGSGVEVLVSLARLDAQGVWELAALEPLILHKQQKGELQRHAQRLEDLNTLALTGQDSDAEHAIQQALMVGADLTGATLLALYLVQACEPALKLAHTLGEPATLPTQLPISEIGTLREPVAWVPGKRTTNSLQRAARAAKWAYLVNAPLGEPEALIGLLVIASPDEALPEDHLPVLKILCSTLTSLIQHNILRVHLLDADERKNRSLAIGDMLKETSSEAVLLLSPDLTIEDFNPTAEAIFGYAANEVCGQPVSNVVIGANNLIPALQAAQQGVPISNLGEVRLHRRDGSAFPAHVRILPLTTLEQLDGVLVLTRDLSEHEQFRVRNQQLEQRALLGEVTAIFAHEVRNPINNISTGLQLMAINLPPDDPNQEVIARLSQDCNRLAHLMQSVLAFSRPPENKMQRVELRELLANLLERWRPRLTHLNLKHEFKVYAKASTIIGDPRALEQVFNNLIGNAVEAMRDSGGRLAVFIRAASSVAGRDQVEVSVVDNGPGIPDEIRERIFEPFFTTNRNGTGLGLAIAKRIVNHHKGTIGVSSVPGGTVFQVILPLSENGK